MIETFRAHKQTFEELRGMALADKGLIAVFRDWTDPAEPLSIGLSAERVERYRSLCRSIGVAGLVVARREGIVAFSVSGTGNATGGSYKDYEYSEDEPSPIVDNLDSYRHPNPGPYVVYRRIEGNWYLAFMYDD